MAGGGGQEQDPFAQLTAAPTPEEQALAAMSPTEALKFSKQLQNARVYSPEEAKANLKQTGYDIASITPVLGNLIAAKDAYDYGGQTLDAAKTGDIREQRKAALMTELSALGAVTGLPFGKIAQQTAKEARSTANIFAGPMARTADKAALEQAQRLEAHGASPDDIWRDTGWGRIDGNWKFEIPDTNAKILNIKPYGDNKFEFTGAEHPEYAAAYGDMPKTSGEYVKTESGAYWPPISPDNPLLFARPAHISADAPTIESARSVTLHELQHHIQNIEGWQGGNNPQGAYDYRPVAQLDAARQDYANKSEALYAEADEAYAAARVLPPGVEKRAFQAQATQFADKATELNKIFSQISKRGYGPYWRTSGEVEARNVQTRRDFTPEQSRATPPWQTQDVPPELYTQLKENQPQGPSAMAIDAYHGSPHEFDQFKLDKIGTGEGAQAYGHGLYFAEHPDTAKYYREALEPYMPSSERNPSRQYTETQLRDMAASEADKTRAENLLDAADRMKGGASFTDVVRSWPEPPLKFTFGDDIIQNRKGRLYKAELDVEPHQLLDWDKPLSEQSQEIRKAVKSVYENTPDLHYVRDQIADTDKLSGQDAVRWMQQFLGPDRASQALHEAGIPGIRYLDQGSRGASGGTSNYVIFDDKLVKIKHHE